MFQRHKDGVGRSSDDPLAWLDVTALDNRKRDLPRTHWPFGIAENVKREQ